MKKTVPIFLIAILFLSNCSTKSHEQKEKTSADKNSIVKDSANFRIMNTTLKERYKKHKEFLKARSNEEEIDYNISEVDITDVAPFIYQKMKDRGYIEPSDKVYKEKLASIFGITEKSIETSSLLKKHGGFTTCIYRYPYESHANTEWDDFSIDRENDYFIDNKHFIMPLVFLPVLIDQITMELNDFYFGVVYHRNMFIFYNDTSSLEWLKENDGVFVYKLLTFYGFDDNKEIIKYNIGGISIDDCDGFYASLGFIDNVKIHENVLQYIVDRTAIDDHNDYDTLEKYTDHLYSAYMGEYKDKTFLNLLNEVDKTKLIVYLSYYIEKVWEKCDPQFQQSWAAGSIMRNRIIFNKNILNEIEENSYYNLPDLKRMIDKNMRLLDADNNSATQE